MTPAERRALLEAVKSFSPQERAILQTDDPALWCYYGLGIMLNSAQETEINNVLTMPPGTIHVWRFANRTGKTSAVILLLMMLSWKKWRYTQADAEVWQQYKYKTLYAAPLVRLMGKAWEIGDSITKGVSLLQQDPRTTTQRRAPLAPFFKAGKSSNPDGSDALWIRCANGAQVDFLSTSEGAGRMEGEAWWTLVWDEFVRQQPIEDIPLIFDQTMLPRSSDYNAPIILSGTATEDSDPIYAEIEEKANNERQLFHFASYGREANFAASRDSIARQMAASFDKAVAQRSVMGELGEGGRGALYPTYLLNNAFRGGMPERRVRKPDTKIITTFDHASSGDLNVCRSFEMPWPLPPDLDELIGAIEVISMSERKSSANLTSELQLRFVDEEVSRVGTDFLIIDATAEGGQLVFKDARAYYGTKRPQTVQVVDCNFTARTYSGMKASNKEMGLQWLQRALAWGLGAQADETGWLLSLNDLPTPTREFGLLRVPESYRHDRRQLAILRREDAGIKQDRAMCYVMWAWFIARWLERRGAQKPEPFNIMPVRNRWNLARRSHAHG